MLRLRGLTDVKIVWYKEQKKKIFCLYIGGDAYSNDDYHTGNIVTADGNEEGI